MKCSLGMCLFNNLDIWFGLAKVRSKSWTYHKMISILLLWSHQMPATVRFTPKPPCFHTKSLDSVSWFSKAHPWGWVTAAGVPGHWRCGPLCPSNAPGTPLLWKCLWICLNLPKRNYCSWLQITAEERGRKQGVWKGSHSPQKFQSVLDLHSPLSKSKPQGKSEQKTAQTWGSEFFFPELKVRDGWEDAP